MNSNFLVYCKKVSLSKVKEILFLVSCILLVILFYYTENKANRSYSEQSLFSDIEKSNFLISDHDLIYNGEEVSLGLDVAENLLKSCRATKNIGLKTKRWIELNLELKLSTKWVDAVETVVFLSREGMSNKILAYKKSERRKYYDCSSVELLYDYLLSRVITVSSTFA